MALFIFNIINIKSEHPVFLQIPHKLSYLVLCLALAAFYSFLLLLVEHLSELGDFLGLLIHLRLYLSQVCDVTQECCLRFSTLASIAFRVILISIVRVELETLDHSVTLGDLLHQQLGKSESLLKCGLGQVMLQGFSMAAVMVGDCLSLLINQADSPDGLGIASL